MSAAQSGNRLGARVQGSGRSSWVLGLAIGSSLLTPTASQAQMQALPPPPSAPGNFSSPDINTAPLPPMAQPMPGIPGGGFAPESAYPMPGQGTASYGGAYQVIVYGGSPYLLRQIKFLEPNASLQNYQGRQVIVAGTFDNPAAAQQRVLRLADYGVGAQAVSTNMAGVGQQVAGMPSPMTSGMTAPMGMTGGMTAPMGNTMNPPIVAPTTDTPPNLFPTAASSTFGSAPTAIAPTAMPMNSLPPASVTPPTAIAPTAMPMNSLANAPMDASVIAPPPGMPMNSLPATVPMSAPVGGGFPLGTATVTPPPTAIPGNSNPEARFEVVIPVRTEDFNAIANRLVSMGVRPDAIQGKEKPRGPHISVGPYMQAREAEAMSQVLRANGMDARVFYLR